jgi:hypothetical protein
VRMPARRALGIVEHRASVEEHDDARGGGRSFIRKPTGTLRVR